MDFLSSTIRPQKVQTARQARSANFVDSESTQKSCGTADGPSYVYLSYSLVIAMTHVVVLDRDVSMRKTTFRRMQLCPDWGTKSSVHITDYMRVGSRTETFHSGNKWWVGVTPFEVIELSMATTAKRSRSAAETQ
jgi:hypothetical protein